MLSLIRTRLQPQGFRGLYRDQLIIRINTRAKHYCDWSNKVFNNLISLMV
jgi:hypothetical protein